MLGILGRRRQGDGPLGQKAQAAVDVQGESGQKTRLLVSYGASEPGPDNSPLQQQLHGPTLPSPNHSDAVLDLKTIDLPIKMMLSSSRDGVVKCWR